MKRLFPLLIVMPLVACSSTNFASSKVFCFDTMVESKLYDGKQKDLDEIENILNTYSKISDNYTNTDVNGVCTINNTNEKVSVGNELIDLLKASFDVMKEGADYFNPLCGSLSKKWKESLKNQQILDKNVINEELEKINNSSLDIDIEGQTVQRNGEAEIDLGGIAKGYALDKVYDYLASNNLKQYLINAGNSSILLGEKNTKDGLFSIGLNDLPNSYLKLKNCFVSTSSNSNQGVKINDVTYSHIINPLTGSAITLNDAVIVVSDKGYYGDAMSTSLMFSTVDEVKTLETKYSFKAIVIKNNNVSYCNSGLEVLHR